MKKKIVLFLCACAMFVMTAAAQYYPIPFSVEWAGRTNGIGPDADSVRCEAYFPANITTPVVTDTMTLKAEGRYTNGSHDTDTAGLWLLRYIGFLDDDTVKWAEKVWIGDSCHPPTEAEIYAEFISGSNEDAFKTDVSGLSTFDPTTDPVATVTEVGTVTGNVNGSTGSIANAPTNWSDLAITPTTGYVYVEAFGDTAANDLFNTDTSAIAHAQGTYGRELLDGGAGGGATPSEIYGYFITGSNEEEFWGDCEPGDGGSKTLVLWVADSSAHGGDTADLPLGQVNLTMYNLGQTVLHSGPGVQTNDAGFKSFASTASTSYEFLSRLTGYQFDNPDTVTTDVGATPDTVAIYGYAFDPGSPAGIDQIRLYGWIKDMSGNGVANAVASLRMVIPATAGRDTLLHITTTGVMINAATQKDTTDADGYFIFDAYVPGDLTPSGCYYEYIARDSRGNIIRGHDKSIRPTGHDATNIADL